ncbi:hypothetical protein M407DRAFT_245919 [Tulasnella calospora MUT 4182]|uniref:Uncharacterized protein n=1 Tax=Tulasnella calospora MUT 4182 TaxID=1051891 RepID=A0A0C3KFA7_9AGAM|nr:hypothetical protein M407DRAFT_245919 [Tulasnella calospora MUT 4182]
MIWDSQMILMDVETQREGRAREWGGEPVEDNANDEVGRDEGIMIHAIGGVA